MENAKKVLMAVITFAGAIYGLYEFYKEHEREIKDIVNPLIKSCEEIKDIKLIVEQNTKHPKLGAFRFARKKINYYKGSNFHSAHREEYK